MYDANRGGDKSYSLTKTSIIIATISPGHRNTQPVNATRTM